MDRSILADEKFEEKQRGSLYSREIEKARQIIIRKHLPCKGTGFIDASSKVQIPSILSESGPEIIVNRLKVCPCVKSFEFAKRFILSNIPYKNLVNQQIYKKEVIDVITKSSIELRDEIIKPILSNMSKVKNNPYGLTFLGPNGTGKTFIGLKILYKAIALGYTAHYIEMSSLLKMFRKAYSDSMIDDVCEEILQVDFLMIDELGNESKQSDFSVGEFKSLYKKRVSEKKPTILVSNFSTIEFVEAYGTSVESIVFSFSKVFSFEKTPNVRKLRNNLEKDSFFRKLKG